jgi:high-affinity nickel permease
MLDSQLITILGLGFLLGARHALDADHVAAVSTILSERPDFKTSGLIGFSWGFGHTAMLLAVGLVMLVLKVTIPAPVTHAFEFGVGLMLVLLGGSLAVTLVRDRWHVHTHRHGDETHAHLHSHHLHAEHSHRHWLQVSVKPFMVGMVHGLAGSAALTLMALSAVRTVPEGIFYILVFGAGSIAGMMVIGTAVSLPLVCSASFGRRAQTTVQGLASLGSIGLGLAMMMRIGLGSGSF